MGGSILNDHFWLSLSRPGTVSHKHKNIAALGEGMLVSFNYHENNKAPIPDEIKARIIDLEKNVNQDFQRG